MNLIVHAVVLVVALLCVTALTITGTAPPELAGAIFGASIGYATGVSVNKS